jgi:hypothetical protein
MKLLYCKRCGDLFKLTRDETRKCSCPHAKVGGRYRKDGKRADISQNAISIAIDNKSLKAAIERMRWWEKHRPESARADYKVFSGVDAWVRPNSGPGNPRSHVAEPKLKNKNQQKNTLRPL